jgi:hypothetical protein
MAQLASTSIVKDFFMQHFRSSSGAGVDGNGIAWAWALFNVEVGLGCKVDL